MGKDERDAQGRGIGRKSVPRTGTGFGSKVGRTPHLSEVTQRDSKGNVLFKLTRLLWRK